MRNTRLWRAIMIVVGTGIMGCGAVRSAGPPIKPIPAVDLRCECQGENTIVVVTVRNCTPDAIYVCTEVDTHGGKFVGEGEKGGPYVFYGGAETLVLYWGLVYRPAGVDTEFTSLNAMARRLAPGEQLTLRHALGPVLLQDTPWAFLIRGNAWIAEHPDIRFQVARVMAIVGYWEEKSQYPSGDSDESIPVGGWRFQWEDFRGLPPATYNSIVLSGIEMHRRSFCWMPADVDLQLEAVAGPVMLPRHILVDLEPPSMDDGTSEGIQERTDHE